MSSEPFVLRWGIIACGHISGVFVKDVLIDPKTRNVHDVVHKVVAAGSRGGDTAKAVAFLERTGAHDALALGTYEEVFAHPDVDAVYIGSPHTSHYANARAALLARKHVLCEKPVTVNAAELRALTQLAREQGVFFMEALWTRFLPIARAIKEAAEDPALGDIRVLHADLSGDFDIDNKPKTHRILDPMLGGGALLDLGSYPFVWASIALLERPQNKGAKPSKVTATMLKTPLTGVDSSTTFVLDFEQLHAQAILSNGITLSSPQPPLMIRFRGGTITARGPLYNPREFTVQYVDKAGGQREVKRGPEEFAFEGGGWHFQADEVARCVRDGRIESDVWSWDKSELEMEVFDAVRKQGDYAFPPGVEQVV